MLLKKSKKFQRDDSIQVINLLVFIISLFTYIPLAKTIVVILESVYSEKLVTTNLTKRTMKNLLKDACSKTAFTINDKI